jgi:hypothetical protein
VQDTRIHSNTHGELTSIESVTNHDGSKVGRM